VGAGAGTSFSHTHWDHIQGIPFFDPLYVPGNEWDIYGPKGLREALVRQMQYIYFPVSLDQCAAKIRYHDLVEGSFAIDDIRVSARYLNHTALTLGYRLEVDGATLVYAWDHEPYSRLLALGGLPGRIYAMPSSCRELISSSMTRNTLRRNIRRRWAGGHSSVEYVVRVAQHALVKRVALTHHDPRRDDDAIERLMTSIRGTTSVDIFAAREGQVVEFKPCADREAAGVKGELAEIPAEQKLASPLVLHTIANPRMAAVVSEALRAESIRARPLREIDAASVAMVKNGPALAIIEHDPPRIDGIALCRALRRHAPKDRLPVLLVVMVGGLTGISLKFIGILTSKNHLNLMASR
jgi:phosphoribosyl 1,2-cyclic phosphodiesterase